ncbi:MAG: MFS transporter [Peptococcaceae bacterium]|nr:MFS transporter [Peptococcaceae bacterium]
MLSLAALSGVPLIMVLGNSMVIPVLPDIKAALNLNQFQSSLIITLFSVPAGLIIPLAGFLSDRFGRKIVIAPSLVLYGLGGIVAGLSALFFKEASFGSILGGRVLQGIGAAGTAPIAMALSADIFTGKNRGKALGLLEASNGLGKVISPVLGSLIGLVAWFAPFLFFPLIVAPVVPAVWFLIKEPEGQRKKEGPAEYIKSLKKIFAKKAKTLLTSFFAGSLALMILFGVLFFLSEYLEQTFGLDGVPKGAVLAVPVLFMTVTSFITGALIKKKFKLMKALVVAGLALITGSLVALPLSDNVYYFFAAISISGTGAGLVLPCLNTIITSSTDKDERGMVTSLYGSVRFFGVAFGPPLFGLLIGRGLKLMAWGPAALTLAAAVLALFVIDISDLKPARDDGRPGRAKQGEKKIKAACPGWQPALEKPLPGPVVENDREPD